MDASKAIFLRQEMEGILLEMPESHRSPFTSDVLDDLVNVLLDGTVFEIVQSLSEIQAETEKLLFRERLELQNTLREEATSGLVTDRREMEIRHRDELRRFDMKAVTQLDQLVMDQQVMLQRSGLPLFHVTTKAEDLKVLMNVSSMVQKLGKRMKAKYS